MAMYHMAMPPHLGGSHPPAMHSPLFPTPLLPPHMGHTYPMQSFPPSHISQQSHTNSNEGVPMVSGNSGNVSMISHPSIMLSQHSPMILPQQASVYINPYLGMSSPPPPQIPSAHSHPPSHPHIHSMGYVPPGILSVAPSQQQSVQPQRLQQGTLGSVPGPPALLSVDDELREEMTTLHLGYIETEDSPRKMEQREKLEGMIYHFCSLQYFRSLN